jgi:hypothetical protein
MPVKDRSGKTNPEKPVFDVEHEASEKGKPAPKETTGLEDIEGRKKTAKESTTEKTSGIKREVLESEVVGADKDTAEMIASFETGKTTAEQPEKWKRMRSVCHTLFTKLFDNGFKKEVLSVLESFRSIEVPANIELNGPEKIAIRKLKEIASQTVSPLFIDLKSKWSALVDYSHDVYENADKTKNALLGQKKGKESKEKETDLFGFIKKHPLASAAVIAAGVGLGIGIYKFIFADEGTSSQSGDKKSSWLDKIKSKPTAILLGLLTVGVLMGPKRIGEWLDKGYAFTKDKVERFIQLLSEGRYKDAFVSLFEGNDDNMENYRKLADIISKETGTQVTDSAIKGIANAKYSIFMSVVGRSKTFASTWVKEIPGLGSTLASFVLDSKEQAAQEDAIRKYFEKNKDRIDKLGLGENATVFQILAKLNDINILVPTSKKTEQPLDKAVDAVDTGLGEVVTFSEDTIKDLSEEFKEKKEFQKLLKKYENDWSQIILHPWIFSNELYKACKADGIPILLGGGRIILVNGYKFVTLTSAKALFNAAVSLIKAPFSDDVDASDAIWQYTFNSMPFILVGATAGLITYLRGAGPASKIFTGAARGAFFPVEVARIHYRMGTRLIRETQGASYTVRRWFGPEESKLMILEDEARFYAKLANKYNELYIAVQPGEKTSLKRIVGKLDRTRIEALRKEYLGRFGRVYNQLHPENRLYIDEKDAASIKEIEKKMLDFLNKQREEGKIKAAPVATPSSSNEPILQKQEGQGLETKHTYKYHNQEMAFTERQIAKKAREIAQEERAAGNIPKAGEETAWNDANWKNAIKFLAEDKILTPIIVEGKPNTYRFAGQEVVITPEELKPKIAAGLKESEALKATCMEKSVAHVTVEDVRIVDGAHEYKIGGKWIKTEVPTEASKLAEVKEAFVKQAKEKGTALDFEKFAMEAKTLKYLPVLEKTMGLAAAVGVIYHLETAPDKRKAVAETAAGFGTFFAGMKLTDWQVAGRIIKTPNTPLKLAARTVIDIMGGLAAAFKLTEPIASIVTNYFEKIPASYGVGKEVADIFEKMAYRSMMRVVFASAEKGILKKLVMKVGLESVGAMFEKKIGGVFLKKIGQLAAKQGFKQVLKALGWRGVTTAALLADDATVIGVLDDLIAIGFIVWMGSDIIEMVRLIANAVEVNGEMEKRSTAKIISFEIKDGASRIAFQEKLTPFGLTVDRAQELGEQAVFDILKTLPQTEVGIKREGIPGRELWTLNNGEAVGIAVQDEMGRVKCQISGQDAGVLDKALDSVRVKEEA